MSNNLKLWYKKPAREWVESLPLGNGRIGAMVSGGVYKERIALNDDTLWTGIPKDKKNYESINYLDEVRTLILNEKYYDAQELMNNKLLAGFTESYAPLGNLYLDFGLNNEEYKDYKRELDLSNAKATISYKIDGVKYFREVFVSYPDNAMVIKLIADKDNSISFTATMDSLLKSESYKVSDDTIALKGVTPINALPSYVNVEDSVIYDVKEKLGMRFQVQLKARVEEGRITIKDGLIEVSNANSVTLIMVANTSFNGFDKEPGTEGKDEVLLCKNQLEAIENLSYDQLYKNHLDDYSSLFNRVSLSLGDDDYSYISTDERLQRLRDGRHDLGLISLYFQYGRYLLIAASREGSQATNLQGIWNEDLRPAWSSNYTVNINTEMNYWGAEVCNLSECHKPLFNMLKELSITGADTAKEMFNCNGWTANHNVDLWRYSNTVGGSSEWGFWPMGGAWMCQHLWEHYDFTRDIEFLKCEGYPIMKGCAEFLLDWLIEDNNGNLVTCPSTSPENNFIDKEGRKCCASIASTMDIAITRDLFTNCINASELLNIDCEFREELIKASKRLPKYKINKYGGIQEWFKDFEEYEPGHRHMSHLFGLYPGKEITECNNKELFEACKKTLERRLSKGGGHTGWSSAWIINFYARLKEPELANKYLHVLLKKLTFLNLFCVHPPFQIDGNFGGSAGIAEMLIQSHGEVIEILPSVPKEWHCGEVKGLRARGGFIINFKWKDNKITEFVITSTVGGKCKLKFEKEVNENLNNKIIEIETSALTSYRVK